MQTKHNPSTQNMQKSLQAILRGCGIYHQSADLFYQRLWHERLDQIGFRVTSVTKKPYHHVWIIGMYGTLTAQSYLLMTKPVAEQHLSTNDVLVKQLQIEVQQIAKSLGSRLRRDHIHVDRKGAYFKVIFVWPLGRPGRFYTLPKQADAFSVLIRPWLRRNRN